MECQYYLTAILTVKKALFLIPSHEGLRYFVEFLKKYYSLLNCN